MGNNKIGFLGAGRMATAIAGGMVKQSFQAADVMAYDCAVAAGEAFAGTVGATVCATAQEMVQACDTAAVSGRSAQTAEWYA